MQKINVFIYSLLISSFIFGQVSGNVNYQNQNQYSNQTIDYYFPSNNNLILSVKGMANVKADSYVAVFSVSQNGVNAEQVTRLIKERINSAVAPFKLNPNIETYVDMISFVPVYEYEVEKKVFSKKTYNEVPIGFELKKNIHLKYTDPKLLDEIVSSFAKAEIYDLVKVDYISSNLEEVKKDLFIKAKNLLHEKVKNYELILSTNLDSLNKQLVDGYEVKTPIEQYNSYKAFNSPSLNLKKSARVNTTDKSSTLYYQPVMGKEFDFVINPTVVEPVIQVIYELKLKIEQENTKTPKEYFIVTPNGDMKKLNLN